MTTLTDARFDALRSLGYTGSTSDMLLAWLQAGGPAPVEPPFVPPGIVITVAFGDQVTPGVLTLSGDWPTDTEATGDFIASGFPFLTTATIPGDPLATMTAAEAAVYIASVWPTQSNGNMFMTAVGDTIEFTSALAGGVTCNAVDIPVVGPV